MGLNELTLACWQKAIDGAVSARLAFAGHRIGAAGMTAIARQFDRITCIMAVRAAIFFPFGRRAVAGGMRAFLSVSHSVSPPSGI